MIESMPSNPSTETGSLPVKAMRQLPPNTVRLIASSQVITSVVSVVKEVVENSLDAGATSIDLKLENYGLDKIEVRDNGSGISTTDAPFMGQSHYTSKIAQESDLDNLHTYGFRGEALGSLCAVADVTITTKTVSDEVSMTYSLNSKGEVTATKPSHMGQGTTVTASHLFKHLPVRKQFYGTTKKKKEELKKMEDLMMSFGLISPDVRMSFRHNKELVWQKTSVPNHRTVLLSICGTSLVSNMEHWAESSQDPKVGIEVYLPKASANHQLTSRTTSDRCFIYVNRRPVQVKEIEKVLRLYYCHATGCDSGKWPVAFLSITIPPDGIDVNINPNKTIVLVHEKDKVISFLSSVLEKAYGPLQGADHVQKSSPDCEDSKVVKQNSAEQLSEPHNSGPATDKQCEKSNVKESYDHLTLTFHTVGANSVDHDELACSVTNGKQMLSSGGRHGNLDNGSPFVEQSANAISHTCGVDTGGQRGKSLSEKNNICDSSSPESSYKNMSHDKYERTLENRFSEQIVESKQHCESNMSTETNSLKTDDNVSFDLLGDDLLLLASAEIEEQDAVRPINGQHAGATKFGQTDQSGCSSLLSCQNTSTVMQNDEKCSTAVSVNQKEDSGIITKVNTSENQSGNMKDSRPVNMQMDDKEDFMSVGHWSRGVGLVNQAGQTLEPARLLPPTAGQTPGKSNLYSNPKMSNHSAFKDRTKTSKLMVGQVDLYDLVSSQPVKRPSTAYICFSRDIRPAVVEENPGANFEQVARIIGQRWRELAADEKQKYEDMMAKDVQRYKDQIKAAGSQTPADKLQRAHKRRKVDQDEAAGQSAKVKVKDKAPTVPHVKIQQVQFSMSSLQRRLSLGLKTREPEEKLHLVGPIKSHGVWAGIHGSDIILFNQGRAQETLILHRLMNSHRLPIERLDYSIKLTESLVGDDTLWKTLLNMEKAEQSVDHCVHITDPRLVYSGLDIRYTADSTCDSVTMEICGMTSCMNFFGVADLKQILSMVSATGTLSPGQCRPTKVQHYLESEAVRMARQLPHQLPLEDVQDIIYQLEKDIPKRHTCFHGRPFLHKLYDLSDLPPSQE